MAGANSGSQYAQRRIDSNEPSLRSHSMRLVEFGEALATGTRLTLFSDDKPDRFFTVIKFWMDATSGAALDLKTGVPSYPSRRRGRQDAFTDSRANRGRE